MMVACLMCVFLVVVVRNMPLSSSQRLAVATLYWVPPAAVGIFVQQIKLPAVAAYPCS
jgi:hypothetical protein